MKDRYPYQSVGPSQSADYPETSFRILQTTFGRTQCATEHR